MAGRFLILACALTLLACSGERLPVPPTGPHKRDAMLVIVPYPPPPARVEVVPPPPKEMLDPVWIDGEWQWKGRRWVWQRGGWDTSHAGMYYAPSATMHLSDGSIAWYSGKWYTDQAAGR
jgi:hypothetical protein